VRVGYLSIVAIGQKVTGEKCHIEIASRGGGKGLVIGDFPALSRKLVQQGPDQAGLASAGTVRDNLNDPHLDLLRISSTVVILTSGSG
jgi:hypothetical protein